MSWISIVDYVADFRPGSTGIVFFKTSDRQRRKTPELQPPVFNSVCAVLAKSAVFDTTTHTFRNTTSSSVKSMKEGVEGFSKSDLEDIKNFATWELPKE